LRVAHDSTEAIVIFRHALQIAAIAICTVSSPAARAAEPPGAVRPAISEEAGTAVSQMGKTLLAEEFSFTAKTIRVYLDTSGQPLHVFHTMKVVARRRDRLTAHVSGDDGSHDLFYDGKSVSIFSPDSNEYATIAAPGDTTSALNEVLDKLNVDFPLVDFFTDAPDKAFLSGVIAGWQVGTAKIDGVECRHLFFTQRGGVELELWVDKNEAATPRRLIVTYRLLPGQPSFVAEFANWDAAVHPSDSEFTFQPPAGAKEIALSQAAVPGIARNKP
jgi:hypothetical protein